MRMDEYVARVATHDCQSRKTKRPLVVFFSFERAPQMYEHLRSFPDDPAAGMPKFFSQAHVVFGRLAAVQPDVDFVIKPKYGGIWETEVIAALQDAGLEIDTLPNLKIVPETNAHQLIFDADVICAYGSTTLLESGIAGKPVIMPCFAEAADEDFHDYVQFNQRDDLFDIATSEEDFGNKITYYLENPEAALVRLDACRAEFENYVSPLTGGACEKYARSIIDTIEKRTRMSETTSNMPHRIESR